MKIRTRAYLLGLLPAFMVAAILGGYLIMNRLGDLDASLKERGGALSRYLVQGAEYAVVSGNQAALNRLLGWTVQEHDVVHAGVYRPDGEPIAEQGRLPAGLRIPLRTVMLEMNGVVVFSVPVVLTPLVVEDPFLQEQTASTLSLQPIAWVQLSISRAGNKAIAQDMLLTALGIIALGLLFATVLVRSLALFGIRPLMEMIAAVRAIASGDFRARLPLTAKSELRDLQHGINQMSEALESFQEDMQRRVNDATAELAEQKEAAERATRAKSQFLAAASHDLRQPMHAIALYVASMKPQVAGHQAECTLEKLEAAVAAMENLFNAILDVSKLDAGAVASEITSVSVKSLLDGLNEEFRPEAEAKGLRLNLRCREGIMVESDPILLGRILRNLISNALRYTERGGVFIAARGRGNAVRFQVWDTGLGIPHQYIEQVFQEFFQVSNPQRDRSQGIGLGLAIVDRLARLLGHSLSFRSVAGKGSVFSLDVPFGRNDGPLERRSGERLEEMTQLRGLVAVVDDDAMVLESLANLLKTWGIHVIAAASGAELLANLEKAPDVLITDYRLRDENGLDVMNALRGAYPGTVIRTVVITGDTSDTDVRALSDSVCQVLHKPVRPARLRTLLSHLLRPTWDVGRI